MAQRSQGQCCFSGRIAPQMSAAAPRRALSARQQLLTIPQLIARLAPLQSLPGSKSCGEPCQPPRASGAAVAEREDTSLPPLPLSTYASPHRPQVSQWLENCIREAVRNLDEAPFLQLYMAAERGQPERMERHNVTATVVQTPQLWGSIAEHLAQAAPEVLVLVHPLDMRLDSQDQKQRIVRGQQRGMSDVLTGVTAHRRHKLHARQTLESLMSSGLAHAELSGRVGEECCDDEVYSQVVPFSFKSSHHHPRRSSLEKEMNAHIGYWGVVVQSKASSEVQGCYVLKTVHSTSPTDCQCTHFTLTRVSRGEPLAAQLSEAWLI